MKLDPEKTDDAVREMLANDWDKTRDGKLFAWLEDYEADSARYCALCARLLQRKAGYFDEHFDEAYRDYCDAAEEQADPYACYGVRRSDF